MVLSLPAQSPINPSIEDSDLYGRWDHVTDGYIRFDDTGKFRCQLFGGETTEGQYRLMEGSAIEITLIYTRSDPRTRRVYVRKDVREYKYSLKDDALRIKIGKRRLLFKKA